MKTTRNNSSMAYVTLEDDTASIEMLAFSNVLSEYGAHLKENNPVVVTGRFSVRDDKDPQIVINRIRPLSDFANRREEAQNRPEAEAKTLYLRLPTENDPLFAEVRDMLHQYPGKVSAVVYFADTKQRRGTHCALDAQLIKGLNEILGAENVVVK